ncbi:hypothetical protein [Caproiciproducens sp. CPB-2]|uniref:hypothetical protein n=1 Tax=Caproiciproducens sp. CPB-2 TaxID=3030017 RepID=UPI0023DBABD3|nr:hypothetical protein [Caproiciproducens sp. CPB-2]MDF1495200.1 hypothetical protein [Caproiciproducens sp. CPB-2]
MNEPEHEPNELTKRLFAEGYTRENYPDYVKPYFWFYGGFTYTLEHLRKMVFSTPCGLLVSGDHFTNGSMSYMGIDWIPENDNPTITCPRFSLKEPCQINHELLRGCGLLSRSGKIVSCACHQVNEPYDYERSCDKVIDDVNKESNELFEEFNIQKGGRACRLQSYYDRHTKQWHMNYDPRGCATYGCSFCNVLQTELCHKKGNVYYDEIVTHTEKGKGLFPDKVVTTATKGKKLLKHQASLTLCEAIVKYAKWRIIEQKMGSYEHKERLKIRSDPNFSVQYVNFRAESRETRDLMDDLANIQEGIEVVHASDQQKEIKAAKHERRVSAREAKKNKLKKRIFEVGFSGLDELELRRYQKWFRPEEEDAIVEEIESKKILEKSLITGEQTKLF